MNQSFWAAVGEASISPTLPVTLTGRGGNPPTANAIDLESPPITRALWLKDGLGNNAVLVTVDLLGVDQAIVDVVQQASELQLPSGQQVPVLLNASHTHNAPTTAIVWEGAAGKQEPYNGSYVDNILVPGIRQAIQQAKESPRACGPSIREHDERRGRLPP
ncbi:MAG: hypothetical protein QM820_06440 [Minicystis sp.]